MARTFLPEFDRNIIIVLLVPAFFLIFNRGWLFPYPNPSDAWLNMAYFHAYGQDIPVLYESYKSGRVAWILKGWLAHSLFPPVVAYYVLHLTMFAGIIVTFYLTARRLVGRMPAFVATVAFSTYSQFQTIVSFEWDYTTHDAALNLLLCLFFLQWAASGVRTHLALILAGAAWASAVQSPYNVSYFPMVAYWYIALNHIGARNRILISAAWFLGGGVAVTLLYGLINWSVGWPFWFFLPELKFAVGQGGVSQYRYQPGYWEPFFDALQNSKGLVLPLLFTVSSAALAWLPRKMRERLGVVGPRRIALVSLCIAFAPHVVWHLYGHPFLSDNHFLVALAPSTLLAFAALVFLAQKAAALDADRFVRIMVPVVMAGPLAFSLTANRILWQTLSLHLPTSPTGRVLVVSLEVAIGCGALALVVPFFRRYAAVAALCVSLAAANIITMSVGPSLYDITARCTYFESQYRVMASIDDFLFRNDPDSNTKLWFLQNEVTRLSDPRCTKSISMSDMFNALHYARYQQTIAPMIPVGSRKWEEIVSLAPAWVVRQWKNVRHGDVNWRINDSGVFGGLPTNWGGADKPPRNMSFNDVPDIDFWAAVLPDNTRLAILALHPDDPAQAMASMRTRFSVKEVARQRFESGGIAVDVVIIDVTPLALPPP